MQYTIYDIVGILPEIIVCLAACILLIVSPFLKGASRDVMAPLSIFVIIAAAFTTLKMSGSDMLVMADMFKVDGFSTYFKMLFYISAALAIILSVNYVKKEKINIGEYYLLILFTLAGMMIIASAVDLLSIYIGIELMALPLYVLVGFEQHHRLSNEASMKYVILGALSSGIMLYGISLIYGLTGTTELRGIAFVLSQGATEGAVYNLALVLIAAGFLFKVAGFPFHMWAPDVYQGAPTPITAFMSVGPKAAAFAAMIRVFMEGFGPVFDDWHLILSVAAILSLVIGSFVAIAQTNLKRMLAYSSIGHAGYILLGLVAGTEEGVAAIMTYLFVYIFMSMGAFAIVMIMSKGKNMGEDISDYKGLATKNPVLALVMLVMMASLAGLPPTAGFIGKFYIFMALIHQNMYVLAIIAILLSAVSAYYYIRVILVMYMEEADGEFKIDYTMATKAVIAVAVLMIIAVGIYPSCIVDLATKAAGIL